MKRPNISKKLKAYRQRIQKEYEHNKSKRSREQTMKRNSRITNITAKRFNLKPGDQWTPEALEKLQSLGLTQ